MSSDTPYAPESRDAPEAASRPTPTDGDRAALDGVSAVIGAQYVVERQLGRGGMATVYLARDVKHDRLVAVKLLHAELAASIGSERFLREIRLAAGLQHPHILGLHDSGATAGQLYYIMPFAEGESLRDRLEREQQLPLDDALRIASEVADALAYAHAKGVIHRDIKPENILLSDGHAVVADFGIARAVTTSGSEKLTESGMSIGTPTYMSPEQGSGMNVTHAADVYSLGCVLYEMLVGEPPYTGPNPLAVMARHSMAEIPSARVVRSSVPPDVEHIITRALAKSPADRYSSAAEMAKALRLAAANTTAAYYTPVGAPPLRRTGNERGLRLGIAAVVVAALALAGARFWPRGATTTTGDARRIAVMYLDDGSTGHALQPVADALTEALATALQGTPGLTVISANGTAPYRNSDVSRDSVARALNVGTLVTGKVEPEGGNVRVTLALRDASGAEFDHATMVKPAAELLALREGVVDEAAQLIRKRLGEALTIRASRVSTTNADAWAHTQRARQRMRDAEAAFKKGDTPATAEADRNADSLLAVAAKRDPRWAEPMSLAAQFAYTRSRRMGVKPEYAAPYIEHGLVVADSALARDSTADALEARGSLRYWKWLLKLGSPEATASDKLFTDARADLERATQKNPAQAGAWSLLSHLYVNVPGGALADAKLAAQRAYDLDAFVVGAEALLGRLASISYDMEQFTEARRYCAELVRRAPSNPKGAECTLKNMGTPGAGAPSVAAAWALAARRDSLSSAGLRPFNHLDSQVWVAAVLARNGLADSARHVLARMEAESTPQVKATASLKLPTAYVYMVLNEKNEALATLKDWVAVNGAPKGSADAGNGWWFRSLKSDPRYVAMFGT